MTNQPGTKTARSFIWFICIAYMTQGIAQHFGLVSQPIDYFMLKELGKNAADVAALLSLLMIPWMIKPVYGLVSDFCPLFGYRRKSYLALAYGTAAVCYTLAALSGSFSLLVAALFVTALGMATGTTIVTQQMSPSTRVDGPIEARWLAPLGPPGGGVSVDESRRPH